MKKIALLLLFSVMSQTSNAAENVLARQSLRCVSVEGQNSFSLNYFIKLYSDNESFVTYSQKVEDSVTKRSYEASFLSRLTHLDAGQAALAKGSMVFETEQKQKLTLKFNNQGVSAQWEDKLAHQDIELKCEGLEAPVVSP
jgi:DUF1009 family protein